MYRSDDGGASWRSIEEGLPSSFGFSVAAHPGDADTLFFLPLNGDVKGRYPPDAAADPQLPRNLFSLPTLVASVYRILAQKSEPSLQSTA